MSNRKSQVKLVKKMISVHPVKHIDIINHFVEDGRHTSESDVVRAALVFYHDKIYPNYVFHLSPAGKLKQKQLAKEEVIESITDEEHALSLKFLPLDGKDGTRYAFYRTIGHQPRIIPMEGFREWIAENSHIIDMNYAEIAGRSVENYFSQRMGERFLEQNNLIPPVFPEGTSD